jgi:hypothetical protein
MNIKHYHRDDAPHDASMSAAERFKETAGVLLAATFTVIAGAGTVLQLVAFFK